MANILKQIAVADATADTDVIKDELLALYPGARTLVGAALTGSAAAGDTLFEILINGKSVGYIENSSTGLAIDMTKDKKPFDEFIPANARVQVKVRTAPGTNPVQLYLEFGSPRTTGRRYGSYRRNTARTRTRRTGSGTGFM